MTSIEVRMADGNGYVDLYHDGIDYPHSVSLTNDMVLKVANSVSKMSFSFNQKGELAWFQTQPIQKFPPKIYLRIVGQGMDRRLEYLPEDPIL